MFVTLHIFFWIYLNQFSLKANTIQLDAVLNVTNALPLTDISNHTNEENSPPFTQCHLVTIPNSLLLVDKYDEMRQINITYSILVGVELQSSIFVFLSVI